MKAALNGVINLSVLDGWWDEGYDGSNGWAIKPVHDGLDDAQRARDEARTLYEILQDKVIPLYYDRGPMGYSPGWVAMAKRSMASIAPRFNAERMLSEYLHKAYAPAADQWRAHCADGFALSRSLGDWKAKVREAWNGVALRRCDGAPQRIHFGEGARFEVAVQLNGLDPSDVAVEIVFDRRDLYEETRERRLLGLKPLHPLDGGEHLYAIEVDPDWCGRMEYRFRAYPFSPRLTHRFEMGLMCWL
jgi:starch phosphorylase